MAIEEKIEIVKMRDTKGFLWDCCLNYGSNEVPVDITKVEETYNAKYVGNFCLKTVGGGWSESPVAIFYQENPPEIAKGSHYFGLFEREGRLFITNGSSAFAEPIQAVISDDEEILFSRYRWDFRTSKDKSVSVDGGRDYFKVLFDKKPPRTVDLVIDKDKLVIQEKPVV